MELDVEVIRYLGHAYLPHIEVRILFGTLVGTLVRTLVGTLAGALVEAMVGTWVWSMVMTWVGIWVRHGSGHEPGRGSRHS